MEMKNLDNRNGFKLYFIIATLAFICNVNTLFGTFVFDDVEAIVKNKDVYSTTALSNIFHNDFWGTNIKSNQSHKSYRPLTTLTYRLNIWLSDNELNPIHFHVTNLLLYIILCMLTVPVVNDLLKRTRFAADDTAFLCSLLFALHPIHTEAVAGLVGRADLLGAILFMLAFLLYKMAVRTGSMLLIVVVNALALTATFCKENSITILMICCVYELLYTKSGRRILIGQWHSTLNSWLRMFALAMGACVILFLRMAAMDFRTPQFAAIDNPATSLDSCFAKIMSYNYIYFLNVILLLWPQWLCFDWSMGCIPLIHELSDIRIGFVIIFWTALIGSCVVLGTKFYVDELL